MDQKDIQHLANFIRNNPTYTADELADFAFRTGYTKEEFDKAMKEIGSPIVRVAKLKPDVINKAVVDKLKSPLPGDLVESMPDSYSDEVHSKTYSIAADKNISRKSSSPSTSYLEVILISIGIFLVTFVGLYCYTNGVPPFILSILGLR